MRKKKSFGKQRSFGIYALMLLHDSHSSSISLPKCIMVFFSYVCICWERSCNCGAFVASFRSSKKRPLAAPEPSAFSSLTYVHTENRERIPSFYLLTGEEFCHLSNLSFFSFPLESPQLGIVGVLFALLYNRMEDDLPILMHSVEKFFKQSHFTTL